MVIEARGSNPSEMFVVWLPFDRIFGKRMLSIFESEGALKDVDQRLFACQTTFPIEQEIPKASVPCLRQRSCLANGREGAIHVVWFKLLSRHPAQDLCWRMTTIFPFFVGEVFLIVVIQDPLFVRRHEVFPTRCRLKIPVSHPSLYIKRRFYQILPALPLLNLFLLNAESGVDVHCAVVSKHTAVIAD